MLATRSPVPIDLGSPPPSSSPASANEPSSTGSTATRSRQDITLPVLHGGAAAPDAWLALWRGDAWVCWRPAPACWQRLDLAGLVDLALLRAEFTGPSALVLGDRSEATWRIDQGDPVPRAVAGNPGAAPRAHACGPRGPLPVIRAGLLEFADRPCPEAPAGVDVCVAPGRAPAVRPVTGMRVRLGLELRVLDRWQQAALARTATGVALLATLDLGFDHAFAHRRERADLQAQARRSLRSLPAPRSRGPLAAAEREALAEVVCGGAP